MRLVVEVVVEVGTYAEAERLAESIATSDSPISIYPSRWVDGN